jgi:hypothetical protein
MGISALRSFTSFPRFRVLSGTVRSPAKKKPRRRPFQWEEKSLRGQFFSGFAVFWGGRAARRGSTRQGAFSPLQLLIASEEVFLFHLTRLVNQNPRDLSPKVMPGPTG